MKLTKINFQKSFVIGPYLQEKVGVEIELDDTDGWDESFQKAKELVDKWGAANGDVYNSTIGGIQIKVPVTPQPIKSIDRKAIERLEKLIDDCTSIDELVKFKDEVGPLGLIDLYHAKYDQIHKFNDYSNG